MDSDIERRELEAHVVLCAERYQNLDDKLDSLEKRTTQIEKVLNEIRDRLFMTTTASKDKAIRFSVTAIVLLITIIVGLIAYDFQRIDNAVQNAIQKDQRQSEAQTEEQSRPKKAR